MPTKKPPTLGRGSWGGNWLVGWLVVLRDLKFALRYRTRRVATDPRGEAHRIHERLKPSDLVIDSIQMHPQHLKL